MNDNTQPSRRGRHSLFAVALLVAATLALGAATRAPAPGATSPPPVVAANGGPVSLSARLDRTSVIASRDGIVRMEIGLSAEQRPGVRVERRPTDLMVILDRSGSMDGQKIADARAAVHHLIAKLGPEDRFGLVTFSSGARTEIPLTHATADLRADWSRRVSALHAGGGTYMGTGLRLALDDLEAQRAAGRTSRAIVLSDGLAADPPDELRGLAARAVVGEYTLSAVGVGQDFDEQLMSSLADAGTGNYYFLDDTAALAQVFASEFETAQETVASAVALTLTPGAGVTVVDAAGYPLEFNGSSTTFRPGSLFAGQERRVWVTFRVPVHPGAVSDVGSVRLDYRHSGELRRVRLGDFPSIASVEDEDRFLAGVDGAAWADGAAVEQYNALRQAVAQSLRSGDRDEAVREIRRYRADAGELNARFAAPKVKEQIDAAAALEAEVGAAFDGVDSPEKRNRLGKKLHAEGTRDRRVGSRK